MVEKYCDINYRDYLLEIEQDEFVPGKFHYCGRSQDKVSFFAGPYSYVHHPINKFTALIDEILGEREKEEEILFCTIIYNGYELEIWLKEDLSYYAHIAKFDFASWGTWSNEELVEVIEAFRKKVDSGTGENLIQNITDYKGHRLVVRKKKDSNKYLGTSTLLDGKWRGEGWKVEDVVKRHQTSVDRVILEKEKMLGKTYDTVCEEWGNTCYSYESYKNFNLTIKVRPQGKDRRALYVGRFSDFNLNYQYRKTFESIHYDKVVSRFQRFVDEYCTDWVVSSSIDYKNYTLGIKRDRNDCDRFFGTCEIHKNSTFKCISNSLKEIEEKFKVRINRMIEEKEKVQRKMLTPKQEKIQELEQLLARISSQLEELKKEKDTWIYKGVVLEYGTDEELDEGYFVARIKNAPKATQEFYGKIESVIKSDLENYIDRLEDSYNLYLLIYGKEL